MVSWKIKYSFDHKDENNVKIHVMNINVKNVCKSTSKSAAAKERDLGKLVTRFIVLVKKICHDHPNTHVYISACLPRYDGFDQVNETLSGRDFVNALVAKNFKHFKNVTVIPNDGFTQKYFVEEKKHICHLSKVGFAKMMSHWKAVIGNRFS